MTFREGLRACVRSGSTRRAIDRLLTQHQHWIRKRAAWLRKRHRVLAINHEQEDVEQELRIMIHMLCRRFRYFCRKHKIETKSNRAWRQHIRKHPSCDVCDPAAYVLSQMRGRWRGKARKAWQRHNRRHEGLPTPLGFEGDGEVPDLVQVAEPTQHTEVRIREYLRRSHEQAPHVLTTPALHMFRDMAEGYTHPEVMRRARRTWSGNLRKDARAAATFLAQQQALHAPIGG